MCSSCGCARSDPSLVNDDHGNPDNITLDDLKAALKAGDVEGGLQAVARNIAQAVKVPQSFAELKDALLEAQ